MAHPALAERVPAGTGTIEAWWADGRGLPAPAVDALASAALAAAERRRYGAMADPLARTEFVLARSVLRGALGRARGCPPAEVPLDTDGGGRPLVPDAPDTEVSITHSGGVVAVALGTGLPPGTRIGVDIERVRPVARDGALARRYFSAAERAWLDSHSGPDRQRAWLDIWTRREAWAKALGTGLRGLSGVPDTHLVPDTRPGHGRCPLRLPRGFIGSLVALIPGRTVRSSLPPPPQPLTPKELP
ncbi:4'-phosphopantetheinyl transferase family protein [Streptomyces sp. SHP 1-2]|uniref:4'-phosphopantetheinyl transferase family protein n=1 Tax=Streptomyces sp. SHP 1-2 TaxID=2769489 RepID=UPI00223854A4|nr:4'-phosphopantetheinyl transferase superfamily protein [Streptomyces sp. SHP 1-2]MCW5254572.1 4'-phosphopantetheinyl transferase superfamily protein [Streptomyces sp. SHP 1-2]